VRAKLRGGEFVKVVGINRVSEPWLAEVVGQLGFDVVWFDMEHRSHDFDVIDRLSLACRATGIDLMVRICKNGYTSIMRALEFGANGIMVPHCCSAGEAQQWVDWSRFPPAGTRGYDHAGADANYGLSDPIDYLKQQNDEIFLAVQIEDKEAVDRVEEIAGVDGVDLLFVGPADLSISYGVPLQRQHPALQRAIDKVANAVAKKGKWWGTVTETPEVAQIELNRGARMITCANDHFLLVDGLKDAYRDFKEIGITREYSQASRAKTEHADLSGS
jgi:4-hydroxy-2-oxoheptanedioate aldolase